MPSSRASPTLPENKQHTQFQSMDIKSCLKASLLALSLLSMVTWLPHIYSCLRTFILVSLPSLVSTVVAPKCLFIFSNIIVLFLVSESKLSQSSSESLNTGDGEGDRAAAQDDTLQTQRQEEEAVMEAFAHNVKERKQEGDRVVLVEQEDTAEVCEAVVLMDQQEKEDDVVLGEVDEMRGVVVQEEGGVELMLEEEMREGKERREVEELVERDLPPADELNRRVEDFIARFNMERQLEARMLVCCC